MITAEAAARAHAHFKTFLFIAFDRETPYWVERRPDEGGRSLIMSQKGEITPEGYSVKTRLYDYGGSGFACQAGTFYFVNEKDQRIYKQRGKELSPLTGPGFLWGDLQIAPYGLLAVGMKERPFLALLDKESGQLLWQIEGHDFYAAPALSPGGQHLSWLAWDYPSMPWDETLLYRAEITQQGLKNISLVAEGACHSQPSWSPGGQLHYISNKTGYGNLYCEGDNLYPASAEMSQPGWNLGSSTYAFWGQEILFTLFHKGGHTLHLFNRHTKRVQTLPVVGTFFNQVRACSTKAAYITGSGKESLCVKELLPSGQESYLAGNDPLSTGIAEPLAIEFPSSSGHTAYGYYYPPLTKSAEKPPLLIKVHGGPTGQALPVLQPLIQFWTAAGFAVLDLNYGGSTGFGKAYQESLYGKWGLVDVQDLVAAATYLISKEMVDPHRVVLSGSSAGGFTVLSALICSSLFAAAACYYGISDLSKLPAESGYFEAHYHDRLLGPYPAEKELYIARSPLTNKEKIKTPLIFFHGGLDLLVPPLQTASLHQELQKRGLTTEFYLYENEVHGFRNYHTLLLCLKRELAFYQKIFSSLQIK